MLKLLHTKLDKPKLLTTFPNNSTGNDGDIVISRINGKGVFLCSKAGGMWYAANKMQELKKLEKTSIRDLMIRVFFVKMPLIPSFQFMNKKDFLHEIQADSDLTTLEASLNWIRSNKLSIEAQLEECGAILFSNLPV